MPISILVLAAILIIWAFQLFSETAQQDFDKAKEHRKGTTPLADTEDEPVDEKAPRKKKRIFFAVIVGVIGIVIIVVVVQAVFFSTKSVDTLKAAMEVCIEEFGYDQSARVVAEQDIEYYLEKFDVSSKEELNALFTKCVKEQMASQEGVIGDILREEATK